MCNSKDNSKKMPIFALTNLTTHIISNLSKLTFMIKFNTKTLILATMAFGLSCPISLANNLSFNPDSRLGQQLKEVKHVRDIRGVKPFGFANSDPKPQNTPSKRRVAQSDPVMSFQEVPVFSYLDGPDGNTWFYTTDFTYEERVTIPEYDYSEEVISGFHFTIYDGSFNKKGEINGKIDYAEGETRTVLVEIDPTITRNFFNSDDNLELMVYVVKNTTEYINHSNYTVYSLGGEKDGEGNDVGITTLEGRLIDTINAGTDGQEDYFFTFQSDAMVDLDADYPTYVDFLNSYVYRLTTFTKNTDGTGIKEIFSKDIYCTRIPGDTTDGIYFISKPFGGKMYFIYAEYEKPYFVDPTGMSPDESATPDNSLTIEVYSTTGGTPEKVSYTAVPVPEYEQEGALIYSYLNIGTVAWTHDIDMSVEGTPEAPAFIVSLDVQNAAEYEEYISSSFDLYDVDGKLIRNLATNTGGMTVFRDGDTQPQIMYIYDKGDGSYDFKLSNLYSNDVLFTIDQNNDGDHLSARCDRVRQSDGTYKFAFEMTYYDKDEEGDEYVRVAWYNADGSQDRIDKVKVGKDVMAAQVNMASSVLNPTLFDDDDLMEYAALVKRSVGGYIKNEFVIVDDNGDWYAHFTEDDNKGMPYTVAVVFGEKNQMLMIYNNAYTDYNIDLYDLPFDNMNPDKSGIENVVDSTVEGIIKFDGSNLTGQGQIDVYDTLGVKIASGSDNLSVANLPSGIYIAISPETNTTLKFRK